MTVITREQRVNPVLDGGRPTAQHETNPGAYSIWRAHQVHVGMHIVNHGEVDKIEANGVFRTFTYRFMVWDLRTGTGTIQDRTLTLHAGDALMVETPGIQQP